MTRPSSRANRAGRTRPLQRVGMLWIALVLAGGCAGVPDGVEPVRGFDLERYLGTWYEIARLDHRFERGLTDITAQYRLRKDGDVEVINRGWDTKAEEWSEAVGRAVLVGEPDVGQLKVSFFGPFYGGYNVIDLDQENYGHALVAGPNRSYLWILAREPEIAPELLQRLVDKARGLGFPTDELIRVDHSRAARSQP